MTARAAIDVLVGILVDEHDRILIAQRPPDRHMGGSWEFPGGKRLAGEAPFAALCREIDEEVGVAIDRAEPFMKLVHDYPDRRVQLDVWWVTAYRGQASSLEGQSLRWVDSAGLVEATLLPADQPIVDAITARLAH